MLVEGEDVWRTDCTVFSCYVLTLIAQIGKIESFVFGSRNHVVETVFRIIVIVVAVDRNQHHTFSRVVSLQLYHPSFVSLNVRTMVTAEGQDQGFLFCKILQSVSF